MVPGRHLWFATLKKTDNKNKILIPQFLNDPTIHYSTVCNIEDTRKNIFIMEKVA